MKEEDTDAGVDVDVDMDVDAGGYRARTERKKYAGRGHEWNGTNKSNKKSNNETSSDETEQNMRE